MAIEFYRDKALPESLTVVHDGIWFIKPDGVDKMKIYLVYKGNAISLDVIDMQVLTDALKLKADDNKVVKTSGDQNVDGVKTFLKIPKVSADAEDDNELVRLSQVLEMFAGFDPPEPVEPPEDGITPRVGSNGNWWIGDEDTGVKAMSSYTLLYDSEITGIRNDSNNEFRSKVKYVPGTLKVYMDGLLLTKGNNEDFVELDPGQSDNGALINRIVTHQSKLTFEFIAA